MAIWLPIVSEFKKEGIEDASKGLTSLGKKSGAFSVSIGKAMKVAGAAILGVGAAVGVAAYAAVDFAKAAAEDEEAAAKLAGQLRRSVGATDAQVKSTEKLITTMALATGVADDELRPALAELVRGSGDLATANKDLALALDIAAGSGKDVGTVAAAMSKAYGGNLTSLAKLDPAIRKIVKGGGSLDDVMTRLSDTFGGAAAESADTTSGKMRRLSIAFNETKEAIGARLLPIVNRLMDFFMSRVMPIVERLMRVFDKRGLAGVFKVVSNEARAALPGVVSALSDMGRQLVTKLAELGRALVDWIGPRIPGMLQKLGEFIAAAANWLLDVGIPRVVDKLTELGQKFVDWVGPQIPPLLTELGRLLGAIGEWVVTRGVPKLAEQAIKLQVALSRFAWNLLPDILAGLRNLVVELVRRLPDIFAGLVRAMGNVGRQMLGALLDVFRNIGSTIFDGLKNAFQRAILYAVIGLETAINAAIRLINTILEGVDRAAGPLWDFDPIREITLGFRLPQGEGFDDPADEVYRPTSRSARRGNGDGRNVTITVNGALDPVAVAGQIRRILNDDARRRTGTLAIP